MIDGNAISFINKLYYEDHYILYGNSKYFLNGCTTNFDDNGKAISSSLEVYNLDLNCTIFSVTKASARECIEAFEEASIWSGKTFWDEEKNMKWIDN